MAEFCHAEQAGALPDWEVCFPFCAQCRLSRMGRDSITRSWQDVRPWRRTFRPARVSRFHGEAGVHCRRRGGRGPSRDLRPAGPVGNAASRAREDESLNHVTGSCSHAPEVAGRAAKTARICRAAGEAQASCAAPESAAERRLACTCAPAGRALARPRGGPARRRRPTNGARLSLATARHLQTLGGRARWIVEGNLLHPAVDREPAAPCPQGRHLHCHEKHRVTAVVDGVGVLQTEDGDIALRPGDILVLAPGVMHGITPSLGSTFVLLTFEFAPGTILTPSDQPLWARVFGDRPVIRCSPAAAAEAQSLLHRVRAEQRREKAAGVVAMRAYLTSLLVLLYRRGPVQRGVRLGTAVEPLLRDTKAYMEAHFAEPLRVADLAARTHLGVRQFTARFKRAFGEPPIHYLTRLRVAAAQDLLSNTSKGVADVAREVGYENLSHFYRVFVQHAGLSPGRYRQHLPEVPGTPVGKPTA